MAYSKNPPPRNSTFKIRLPGFLYKNGLKKINQTTQPGGGGGGNAIYVPYGDVPLMRVGNS